MPGAPYALRPSVQTNIVLAPTGLTYDQSRAPPHRRTAAPNRIKRTTHTPFFSTTSRDKCSFFRLPAEIRCLIYHELLVCGVVNYHICPATRRLLLYWYQIEKPNYPYLRHGLYPSILECCRLAYEEGAAVLYGENQFSLAACAPKKRTVNTWPLSKRNIELITSLSRRADIRLRYSEWDMAEAKWVFDMERTEAACFGLYKPVLEQYLPSTKRTKWKLKMSPDLPDGQRCVSFKVEVSWGRDYREKARRSF
ncbi:unnamed protein product [Parascedosporium putredinis]|uniref:Uncharacterized protein n=1 Tax=Parascedosporium putredinis TaxID=1442378 RepID=A0A9P1MAV8_9PEZI|nr:unnamed protein product [Parascedosporium putredinis]CAI7997546.1 unnamed protein product [Parascedosporium putredinis]